MTLQSNNHEEDPDEATSSTSSTSRTSPTPTTTPTTTTTTTTTPPRYVRGEKILARDSDGLYYIALVRRTHYGIPQQHKLGLVETIAASMENSDNSTEEEPDDDDIDDDNNNNNNNNLACARWFYFVHFLKWKVNWDRWMDESDLMPCTEDNLALQERVLQEHRALMKSFKTASRKPTVDGAAFLKAWKNKLEEILSEKYSGAAKSNSDNSKRPKKKRPKTEAPNSSSQQQYHPQQKLVNRSQEEWRLFSIPIGLKRMLVEEWEILNGPFVMVHDLCMPRGNDSDTDKTSATTHHPSIHQVLQDYLQSKNVQIIKEEEKEETKDPSSPEEGGVVLEGESKANEQSSPRKETTPDNPSKNEKDVSSVMKEDSDDNKEETEMKERHDKEWRDMVDGIFQIFDQALPFRLLYPNEQSQFQVFLDQQQSGDGKPTMSFSQYYGSIHLLRLVCQLPTLLLNQYPDEELQQVVMKPILAKTNDLLRFLQNHQGKYFPQRFRKKNEAEEKLEQKWVKRYEKKRMMPDDAASHEAVPAES